MYGLYFLLMVKFSTGGLQCLSSRHEAMPNSFLIMLTSQIISPVAIQHSHWVYLLLLQLHHPPKWSLYHPSKINWSYLLTCQAVWTVTRHLSWNDDIMLTSSFSWGQSIQTGSDWWLISGSIGEEDWSSRFTVTTRIPDPLLVYRQCSLPRFHTYTNPNLHANLSFKTESEFKATLITK